MTGLAAYLRILGDIGPGCAGAPIQPNKAMPVYRDYIPSRDADFALWAANFATLIAAAPTAYGLIVGDATAISAANDAFQAAYVVSTTPETRTSATVATTRGARATAQAVFRPYAMRINANQSVTNAQRVDLGLTVRTLVPTPIPPPATSPALLLVAATPGQHQLQARDSATPTSKAKPFGVIGLELWVAVGTVAAVSPEAGSFKQISTKTPFQVGYGPADVGKVATYFGRWITRSGNSGIAFSGPWSAPLTSVII